MGTETIPTRTNGQVINETWFNILKTVMSLNWIPRNASGVASDEAGDLGTTSYRWRDLFFSRDAYQQGVKGGITPTGAMLEWGGDVAPSGWLLCDGAAVSRTTYADLYGVIGTKYGYGDNSTTFNLPDWRGMFARGVGIANKTFTSANVATGSSDETVTITAHGYNRTGMRARVESSGTVPGGLSEDTTYYLIIVDANKIAFATSRANALAGTPKVNLTNGGSGTHTIRFWEAPDVASAVAPAPGASTGVAVGSMGEPRTALPVNDFVTGGTNESTSHDHSFSLYNSTPDSTGNQTDLRNNGTDSGANDSTSSASVPHTHDVETGGDNETRPVYLHVNKIIKY